MFTPCSIQGVVYSYNLHDNISQMVGIFFFKMVPRHIAHVFVQA